MRLTFSLDNIENAAREFILHIGGNRIFSFYGDMGAGKTTFIAEVCKCLGVKEHYGSPTFSIINEYADSNGEPIYHFDFYRIENPAEALEIGVEEYFYSGNLCFVEWPERIGNILPDECREVRIGINADGTRDIEF